jgi:tetratricopeptide (TPR) repeat protein
MTTSSFAPGSSVPGPNPEQRRAAVCLFERANQVVATGDYDHGIRLLFDSCKLDPANLLYRQALRRAEKARYRNNLHGCWLAWLWSWPLRARLEAARAGGRNLDVLEQGERILMRNPWDVGAQASMAAAAHAIGLLDLAIWSLEQARHKEPGDAKLNRFLAQLYERRGNFTQALALWKLVAKSDPGDGEAKDKLTELALHESSQPGPFEPVALLPGRLPQSEQPDPVERQAADLRERLAQDPRAAGYLELARLYRTAGRLAEAHAALTEGLAATGNPYELTTELVDLEIEPFRRNLAITQERLAHGATDELRRIELHLHKEINTRELDLHRFRADRFPHEAGHRYELGVRLFRAGQLDEAIRELQAAGADARFRWKAALCLGHCFGERKKGQLALRHFEEALASLPAEEAEGRKEVLYELARAHADAGDVARALDVAAELAAVEEDYRGVAALREAWQARVQQV